MRPTWGAVQLTGSATSPAALGVIRSFQIAGVSDRSWRFSEVP
jgi:hypothetical protein